VKEKDKEKERKKLEKEDKTSPVTIMST